MTVLPIIEFEQDVANDQLLDIWTEGDNLVFKSLSLTDKYVPENILSKNAWSIENKEIRYRHKPPEELASSFMGYVRSYLYEDVVDSKGDKRKGLITENVILGNTAAQKKAQDAVKECYASKGERGLCGVSVGFVKLSDDKGNTVGMHLRELSLTPRPKCHECGAVTISGEVLEMNPKRSEDPEGEQPEVETETDDEKIKPKKHDEGGPSTTDEDDDLGEGVGEDAGKQRDPPVKKFLENLGFESLQEQYKGRSKVKNGIEVYEDLNKQLKNHAMELEVYTEQLTKGLKGAEAKIHKLEEELSAKSQKIQELETQNRVLHVGPLAMRIAELKGYEDEASIRATIEKYIDKDPAYLRDLIDEMEEVANVYSSNEEYEDSETVVSTGRQEVKSLEEMTDPDEILQHAGFSAIQIADLARGRL